MEGAVSATITALSERRYAKEFEKNIEGTIRSLSASGIDGILPLDLLIRRCRDPKTEIPEEESGVLMRLGLLWYDGSVPDEVRKVVLAGTFAGAFFGL